MNRKQHGWLALLAGVVLGCLFAAVGWRTAGEHPPVLSALTWTGRLAFAVFLVPLFASPARRFWRGGFTAWLMGWRRRAGIAYGAIQLVHLVLIALMFQGLTDPPVEAAMVAIGGLGLVLAGAMLVTSFDAPTRALGPRRWRALHKAGFYVFMFIYFYDFVVKPSLTGAAGEYWPLALLTLAGMALRTAAWLLPRQRGAVPA